jgi:16S rRNA processing protein RimM
MTALKKPVPLSALEQQSGSARGQHAKGQQHVHSTASLSDQAAGPKVLDAAPASASAQELMVVGRVVAAQGLAGEMRVVPLSDFPERFTRAGNRWLRCGFHPPRPVELIHGRSLPRKKGLYVVRLSGVNCREDAEALVGAELLVLASDRPPLKPGEVHLLDLLGLRVHRLSEAGTPEELPIGTVTDLIHAGNDLLEIETAFEGRSEPVGPDRPSSPAHNARKLLIPFVPQIVPIVNLEEGWIGITPPPGLLEL